MSVKVVIHTRQRSSRRSRYITIEITLHTCASLLSPPPPPSPLPPPLSLSLVDIVYKYTTQHWAIQGAPPNLVPREAPPTMDKVPSVFAEDIGSSKPTVVTTPIKAEGEELMETDELDVSICDNLVVSGRQTN